VTRDDRREREDPKLCPHKGHQKEKNTFSPDNRGGSRQRKGEGKFEKRKRKLLESPTRDTKGKEGGGEKKIVARKAPTVSKVQRGGAPPKPWGN